MRTGSLSVNETFVSLQGESSYAGRLCYFIRLAGCNLKCSYCDTLYSNSPEKGVEIPIDTIVDKVLKEGVHLVEITGGEPLLQHETAILCKKLIRNNLEVMIETNGTFPISKLPKKVIKILDCKTPSSGEADKMFFENFSWLDSKDEVKFIISDWSDYDYSVDIISKYGLNIVCDTLLFSPVWEKMAPKKLAEQIIKDRLDVRMQLQMHKIIWGPEKQGV